MTLLTVTPVEEMATVAPETKFVPVRVTGTLAPRTPLEGAMEVRVGAVAALTVKTAAAVVPPVVVTETLRAPVAAVAEIVSVAVIWVALTTVMLLTVISAGRDIDRRRGEEVRAGEGDGDGGALEAARGSNRGEGRGRQR